MKKTTRYWIKLGIIGFLIGIVHHLIYFLFLDRNFFLRDILDSIYSFFCKIFQLDRGESCGGMYLIFLPIALAIIGLLVGLMVDSIKKT